MNGHCDTPAGEKYPDIQGIAGEGMTLQERLKSEAIEKYGESDFAWNDLETLILHTIEETIKEGCAVVEGMRKPISVDDLEVNDIHEIYKDGFNAALTDTQHALRGIIG
jgi:hypothetical protein